MSQGAESLEMSPSAPSLDCSNFNDPLFKVSEGRPLRSNPTSRLKDYEARPQAHKGFIRRHWAEMKLMTVRQKENPLPSWHESLCCHRQAGDMKFKTKLQKVYASSGDRPATSSRSMIISRNAC